jgi:predicted DNA-binding transcriptional regulator YafY
LKIDRLISIIMILLERKKISAVKLAEMFEVTPRTIYRDIETINLAGIPIITYPGINGGVGIMEEYKIDKKLFTTSDIATLLMGLGSISNAMSNDEIINTLAKVKGLVPAEQIRDIELKIC